MADPSFGTVMHLTSHVRKAQVPMLGRTATQMPRSHAATFRQPPINPQAQCAEETQRDTRLPKAQTSLVGIADGWTRSPSGKEHTPGRQMVANALGIQPRQAYGI